MTSSDFLQLPRKRRRRRPHRVLRAFKLALPFLLLLAVGLLSAGVIRLVEVTAAPPIPVSKYSAPVRQGSSADPSLQLGANGSSGMGAEDLGLGESQTVRLEAILPTSFLEEMPQERAADSLDAERAPGTAGVNLRQP